MSIFYTKNRNFRENHEYSWLCKWANLHNIINTLGAVHKVSFDTNLTSLDQL
jgi:hypothetical protein